MISIKVLSNGMQDLIILIERPDYLVQQRPDEYQVYNKCNRLLNCYCNTYLIREKYQYIQVIKLHNKLSMFLY